MSQLRGSFLFVEIMNRVKSKEKVGGLKLLLLSRFSRGNSVRPHRRQPTRLLCPWDSPGKNTGVGCHFPLQCMKVKSENEVTQSCLTLSDPMDCLPGSPVPGILQARILEWVVISFSSGLKQWFSKCGSWMNSAGFT